MGTDYDNSVCKNITELCNANFKFISRNWLNFETELYLSNPDEVIHSEYTFDIIELRRAVRRFNFLTLTEYSEINNSLEIYDNLQSLYNLIDRTIDIHGIKAYTLIQRILKNRLKSKLS